MIEGKIVYCDSFDCEELGEIIEGQLPEGWSDGGTPRTKCLDFCPDHPSILRRG